MKGICKLLGALLPRTPREHLQRGFFLCVLLESVLAMAELFRYGDSSMAGIFIVTAYVTTIIFSITYALFSQSVDGGWSRDSLKGRNLPTGRNYIRRMSFLCIFLLLGRAIYFLRLYDLCNVFVPLVVLMPAVVFMGKIGSRFELEVNMDQDQGILPGS
jgi:hypothetical protein